MMLHRTVAERESVHVTSCFLYHSGMNNDSSPYCYRETDRARVTLTYYYSGMNNDASPYCYRDRERTRHFMFMSQWYI